jgi:uncharacterized MAPEG superfamily protein
MARAVAWGCRRRTRSPTTPPLLSLIGFAAWTLCLSLVGIVVPRTLAVLLGRRRANSFTPTAEGEAPWKQRVARAHMNCVENLPVYGAVVLALAVGGVSDPRIDTLAWVVLGARIAQSTVHLASTSHWMVTVRATFFFVQLGSILAMVVLGIAGG